MKAKEYLFNHFNIYNNYDERKLNILIELMEMYSDYKNKELIEENNKLKKAIPDWDSPENSGLDNKLNKWK